MKKYLEDNIGFCEKCKKDVINNPIVKFRTQHKSKRRVLFEKGQKHEYLENKNEELSSESDENFKKWNRKPKKKKQEEDFYTIKGTTIIEMPLDIEQLKGEEK